MVVAGFSGRDDHRAPQRKSITIYEVKLHAPGELHLGGHVRGPATDEDLTGRFDEHVATYARIVLNHLLDQVAGSIPQIRLVGAGIDVAHHFHA